MFIFFSFRLHCHTEARSRKNLLHYPLRLRGQSAAAAFDTAQPARHDDAREVHAALEAMELEPSLQLATGEGLRVDVAVTHAGARVAIVLEGEWCYVGQSGCPTAKATLRRRQLAQAGWLVMPLSRSEWAARGQQGRIELLTRQLAGLVMSSRVRGAMAS